MILQAKFLPTLKSLLLEPGVPVIHRDLSWLQFNERVLAESRQVTNPFLERAKFLSITASNIDEFFMIRFSSIARSIHMAIKTCDQNKIRRIKKIRSSILEGVNKFTAKQVEALDLLSEGLSSHGVRIVRQPQKDDPAYRDGAKVFETLVLPNLQAPEAFGSNSVTTLENHQLAIIFKGNIWIKIPKSLPNTYAIKSSVGSEEYFIFFLDDLLLTHLPLTFRLDPVCGALRMTRDGDFSVDLEEEDTESIPDVVRSGLKSREKGRPLRMQYHGDFQDGVLGKIMNALRLKSDEVFCAPASLCLQGLWSVVNQLPDNVKSKNGLSYPPLQAMIPLHFRDLKNIFNEIKHRDYLFHHPYDSFDAYVAWIKAACEDADVEMIEQTIYRMDALSLVIELLKNAAPTKKIRVIIELRARFDEMNNLRLADELRKAGVEVAFGFGKSKLHAKVALVTRKEGDKTVLYTHLSTGNYNAATARQYTDLAILTANQQIGADARFFFDKALAGEIPSNFKILASAPSKLHKIITNCIDVEIKSATEKKSARVVAKVNALVDEGVIAKLYQASQAGVKIDLIVRGACSLVPGVKGLSENIRVISVVDRFLEHSRIYYFESSKIMYLSSADWMPRNFFNRLELAFPVLDPRLYQYLEQTVLQAYLNDTVKALELTSHGTWKKRIAQAKQPKVRSQFYFEELAKQEYKDTPLAKLDMPKLDMTRIDEELAESVQM